MELCAGTSSPRCPVVGILVLVKQHGHEAVQVTLKTPDCHFPCRGWRRSCGYTNAPPESALSSSTWTSSSRWACACLPSGPPREPATFTGSFHWPFPQRSLEQNRFGRLTVRCHYEAAEQRLAVEVLHAADLLPLDANGKTRQPQLAVGVGWGIGGRAHNVSSRPE